MVHDAGRGCEDDVAELTRREQLHDPLLHVTQLDVEAWADDAGLVDAAAMSAGCAEVLLAATICLTYRPLS